LPVLLLTKALVFRITLPNTGAFVNNNTGNGRFTEFGSLIDAILDVSSGDSGLGDEVRQSLGTLERPVHIQVFSTPT